MTSQEHTPTTRPMVERVQRIRFSGIYNDAGAEADATAFVGKQRIRYDATLSFLVADQNQAVFTLGKAGSPLETVDELCKKRDRMAYPRIRDSEGL